MGRRRKIPKEVLPEERQRFYSELKKGQLSLAEASRRMRLLLDLDQEEFAKLINVAPRTLIDLETGKGNPTLKTLEKIAKPFGLELIFRPKA
ncbi:MAG: helix-turn-helix domain-containing protein [Candidatus Pacearchaeota archaeon]|nr:helix-turn-helix domain-containing protein [Candidatus Pacearchaeota archaeon]